MGREEEERKKRRKKGERRRWRQGEAEKRHSFVNCATEAFQREREREREREMSSRHEWGELTDGRLLYYN